MRNIILTGAILMTLLTPGGCAPAPEPPVPPVPAAKALAGDAFHVDCAAFLRLREGPSAESAAIGRVPAGSAVTLLGFSERFAHIRTAEGNEGYVLAGYLAPCAPDATLRGEGVVKPVREYSYARLCGDLSALFAAYPGRLRLDSIGASRQGRAILCAAVGEPSAGCHILVQASLHGREHMASLLAMAQLERLLQRGAPGGVCFHIIPMANPDGAALSQGGRGNAAQEAVRARDIALGYAGRGAPAQYYAQWKANAAGVDLNRNFPAQWEDVHTRPEASCEGWRGPAPASEPETRALMEYTRRFPFAATLSYHAMGSELYAEFGPNSPVNERSRALGAVYAAHAGYPVQPDTGASFGGYKDWAISACGIPSLTIELGTRACPLPLREFDTLWLRNRDALLAVAAWAQEG